jgi:hypothetical protein
MGLLSSIHKGIGKAAYAVHDIYDEGGFYDGGGEYFFEGYDDTDIMEIDERISDIEDEIQELKRKRK